MRDFDLQKVIEHFKLDVPTAAMILFPDNMYPVHAINRVLSGKAHLNTVQLSALAKYLGVFIHDLFNVDSWHGAYSNSELVFTYNGYTATYNNGIITLRKNNKTLDTMLIPTGTTITELLTILNQKINGDN